MGRIENWEEVLTNFIENSKSIEFKYGINDCTIWAVSYITKVLPEFNWVPDWTNKREAILRQKKKPMQYQVSEILGPPLPNIFLTKRGDLVQKGEGMDASLGICIGSKVAFLKPKGLCYYDLSDCSYSWRI